MAEANAKLNVLIALKSVVQDGEAALQWITKYGAAIATAAASMAVFAGKQGIQLGSRITDLSNQAGIGSDAFQVLSLTALDSGVSMEEVSKSAAKLRQNIESAKEGNAALVGSLAQLHLTAEGLQTLAPERQWEIIAQRIATATDRQAALNAAADLFGAKNAPKLMETLQRLGVEGYDKLAQGTEKIRLSPEQLKTLDDAGDKLGRIVEHLKYIAAKGTVSVLKNPAIGGTIDLIEQSFNDNEIERAKALIDIWERKGNQDMADRWRANLAALQARATADPYAERNAVHAASAQKDAEGARDAAMKQADAEAEIKKQIAEQRPIVTRLAKEQIDMVINAEQAGIAWDNQTRQAEHLLALKEAELALDRRLRAGREAVARIDADALALDTTKRQAHLIAYQNELKLLAERRAQLEAERVNAGPERKGQIDSQLDNLSTQQTSAQLGIDAATPKSAGYGAMAGMVEYLNSIPDAAGRAQAAVMDVAQGLERGIGSSLDGLIHRTMTWGEALANIGTTVIEAVIQSFIRMAAQWITQQIVMAIFGNAIRAAQLAALLPVTAAMTQMWMPAAVAASIASYGGAAVVGTTAAHTAVYASAAGFADGGPVSGPGTGTSDSIPAWLSNGEYVMPAAETAKYRPLLDAMRAGTLASAPLGTPGAGSPGPINVGGSVVNLHMHANAHDAAMSALRSSEGEAHVVDLVQRNIHRITGRG